jgi:RNA polymerase sporulation-specific sigma factor
VSQSTISQSDTLKGGVQTLDKNEYKINCYVKLAQKSIDIAEKKEAVEHILEMLKPFRYALAKKFANKGVEFDDIAQQIDLKLVEAIYDYDERKDPSALRHLVSKTRNGIWNYYRKEMNYFDETKTTVSLDAVFNNNDDTLPTGVNSNYYNFVDDDKTFDEDSIVEKILIEEELAKLTPRQREIIFMCFIDDMTQYDIAEELSINQANVSRAKSRGIANIKNSINPLDEPNEID